jgi:hypothetical protein
LNIVKAFPNSNAEIYLATDLISADDLKFLQRYAKGLMHPELAGDKKDLVLNNLGKKIEEALRASYPYLKNPKFVQKEIMGFNPGESLRVHYDGVPGIPPQKQPENIASVFYINDDFGGGETFYPTFGLSYKPVAGHLLMHPGKEGYEHGVSEVFDKQRFGLTTFGYSAL